MVKFSLLLFVWILILITCIDDQFILQHHTTIVFAFSLQQQQQNHHQIALHHVSNHHSTTALYHERNQPQKPSQSSLRLKYQTSTLSSISSTNNNNLLSNRLQTKGKDPKRVIRLTTKQQQQQKHLSMIRVLKKKQKQCYKTIRNTSDIILESTTNTFNKLISLIPSYMTAGTNTMTSIGGSSAAAAIPYRLPNNIITFDTSILRSTIYNTMKMIDEILDRFYSIIYTSMINFWYLLPSILCFVPLYTILVWQTTPVTPDVWKLVNMDFVWRAQHAISIIFAFLASNTSFFIAAIYLLQHSDDTNISKSRRIIQNNDTINNNTDQNNIDPIKQQPSSSSSLSSPSIKLPATLGYWVLSAGIVSTLFHTVQAIGNYRIAEALCYIDHGIAGTAICHFYYKCGRPSFRTILCGMIGLCTLAFPITLIYLPLYTFLHSLWHILAAFTAVLWAKDSHHPNNNASISV
jgi:hypothetical protein